MYVSLCVVISTMTEREKEKGRERERGKERDKSKRNSMTLSEVNSFVTSHTCCMIGRVVTKIDKYTLS